VASGDQRFSLGPPFPLPTSQSTTPAPTLAEAISPEAAAAKGKTGRLFMKKKKFMFLPTCLSVHFYFPL
jgi:hypothetical protein